MQRRIAHIDLDAFFVSVELVKDPSLAGKPVIVGATGPRGVVSSCSYEARKMGVRSAMPGFKAQQLCPQGIFLHGNMADYARYSRLVTEIIEQEVPVVEKASIDEFYLDLTGMDRFFQPFELLLKLKKRILEEAGLPISFALASNKLISKIATNEVKPNGQIEILPGTEAAYLAPLSIAKMPGLGEKTETMLRGKGINVIGDLAAISLSQLEQWLGKWGSDLHRKAMGIDAGVVTPEHDQKSMSAEETFSADTQDTALLERELTRLTEKVSFTLRRQGKMAGCVAIKLRYEHFDTHTHQQSIDYTASDTRLIATIKQLFRQHWSSDRPLRLIGVRLSQFITSSPQLQLFDDAAQDRLLHAAVDQINSKMGKGLVRRAGGLQQQDQNDASPLWLSRQPKTPE